MKFISGSDQGATRPDDLVKLSAAVAALRRQQPVIATIARLKREVRVSNEPFVWSSLDLQTVAGTLPEDIRSGWIFVLKRDTWSGAHMHPNSTQHMVMIEGKGQSNVAGVIKEMVVSGAVGHSLEDQWYVIGRGIPHEFRPALSDMVVMSFHTCGASELVEVSAATGQARRYEA